MLQLPADLAQQFSVLLDRKGLSGQNKAVCLKWLRFYWDFCGKYRYDPYGTESLPLFLAKLQEKRQSELQQNQARYTVVLFYRLQAEPDAFAQAAPAAETLPAVNRIPPAERAITPLSSRVCERGGAYAADTPAREPRGNATPYGDSSAAGAGVSVCAGSSWVFVFDTLNSEIKIRHYSPKTL